MTKPEEHDNRIEAEAVLPASCPTHPGLTTVLVRRLDDGRIELGCHGPGGCVLRVAGGALFDVLGAWLG